MHKRGASGNCIILGPSWARGGRTLAPETADRRGTANTNLPRWTATLEVIVCEADQQVQGKRDSLAALAA